ncbi:GNAT family N-acetyltransferase [Bacillus aquiflavi]|uniref:GNAT family N-acetyltransferase n=1 Tax=Bacillus aquiflavi TaxID=2672567 RepID=A0A6B3VSV9_9BACI|nr:GNAT family N-acetyltransferase [Bacillus aquiflavi]NEY80308.1 GNAT family N-acetyltransferase [Bacillus aquiflavi]UAC50025.1 GNAT family N-acetyltransferase [Bacillus aquiflavi]
MPNKKILDGIVNLYSDVFDGSAEDLLIKMKDKPKLLFNIALYGQKIVGFKIGYELDNNKFYSWLGGVDPDYRKRGIALTLIEQQHEYLRKNGYKVVQTKTMNKWRNMLILNIRNGFNIIETYTDDNGLQKIVLEKALLN